MGHGLTHILTVIATGLAMALVRKLFPPPPSEELEGPITDEERRIYGRWEAGSILPVFLLAALFGYGWFLALCGSAELLIPENPGTLVLLRPIRIYWTIPAMFLGFFTAVSAMHLIFGALLGERYPRYTRWGNEKSGYDGWRALRWIGGLILAGSAAMWLLGIRSYARFDGAGIEIGRPLAIGPVRFDYKAVHAVEHRRSFRAPNGNKIERPYYAVIFADGTSWTTRDGLRDPVPEVDRRVAELVAQRSGRPITEKP